MHFRWLFIPGIILIVSWVLIANISCSEPETDPDPDVYSLGGEPLFSSPPSEKVLKQLKEKEENYRNNDLDPDNIIWYGRFTAYAGNYRDAIRIYSEGISKFPDDARFYRHRGHRYITIRKFDEAIRDLEKASDLIQDNPNEMEPDGIPNAQNIPISSLHGNIWYHLGLAYYLKGDLAKALTSFVKCLRSTNNDDNLVSATHWIYTIMCRMNRKDDLNRILSQISDELNVIENQSYYQLCRLYKGDISPDEAIRDIPEGAARDAVDYGIARWYACIGDDDQSQELLHEILSRPGWASFGYIAAEADIFPQ
jgi:tetratricopeptide (TPR) repeat protein